MCTKNTATDRRTEQDKPNPKVILYWTTYYERVDFVFGLGRDPFIRAKCRVNNCFATNNRSQLDAADAVMIHVGNFNTSDLPPHRMHHQRYVFYLYETLPMGQHLPYFHMSNFFNWTMTHRRDSDVYVAEPYGALRLRAGSRMAQQLPHYLPAGSRPRVPSLLLSSRTYPELTKKKKMVAWFSSNCITHGKREKYIQVKYRPH